MKPKPDPARHRLELKRALAAGLARAYPGAERWLDDREEHFVLVPWTTLVYRERRDIELDLPGIERLLANPVASDEERRDVDRFGRKLEWLCRYLGDTFPWAKDWIASDALRETIIDADRYLDNSGGIASRVRQLVIDELAKAWAAGDRVLLIGHSMGSVIAYDSLWYLARETDSTDRVELFMTLGSPLGTRFVREGLLGAGHSGAERFPDNIDRWVNVAARAELVALRPRLKPFFSAMVELGLIDTIRDERPIYNHFHGRDGLDVHKSYGYMIHAVVAGHIARWLGREAAAAAGNRDSE